MTNTRRVNRTRTALVAGTLAAAITGFGLSESGLISPTPSHAEAVRVEAQQVISFADVVEAVSPAVLSVRVEAKVEPASDRSPRMRGQGGRFGLEEFFHNLPRRGPGAHERPRQVPRFGYSQGSGFFVSEDGYVVTNNHVVENGSKFTLVLHDGEEIEAELVGTDPRTDLAVLKATENRKFTHVEFGKAKTRVGDWVVAVGNPFGLGGTVTAGIVSAHGRDIGATRYDDFIQIDAAVNKGNSGGPAFNLNGEVIGINTAIFSPSGGNVGIAFAIPASTAVEVIEELIDNGQVVRGWLGVQIQPVSAEIAESLGLELERGTIVTQPSEDGPAAKAGILAGDIITEVNGIPIKGPKELARMIGSHDPSVTVTLKVWRNGEARDISVTLGELGLRSASLAPGERNTMQLGKLGLRVESLGPDGLLIQEVDPSGEASKKGIRAGDRIVSANGNAVRTGRELNRVIEKAARQGRKFALLQIERGDNTLFVPVPVNQG